MANTTSKRKVDETPYNLQVAVTRTRFVDEIMELDPTINRAQLIEVAVEKGNLWLGTVLQAVRLVKPYRNA